MRDVFQFRFSVIRLNIILIGVLRLKNQLSIALKGRRSHSDIIDQIPPDFTGWRPCNNEVNRRYNIDLNGLGGSRPAPTARDYLCRRKAALSERLAGNTGGDMALDVIAFHGAASRRWNRPGRAAEIAVDLAG